MEEIESNGENESEEDESKEDSTMINGTKGNKHIQSEKEMSKVHKTEMKHTQSKDKISPDIKQNREGTGTLINRPRTKQKLTTKVDHLLIVDETARFLEPSRLYKSKRSVIRRLTGGNELKAAVEVAKEAANLNPTAITLIAGSNELWKNSARKTVVEMKNTANTIADLFPKATILMSEMIPRLHPNSYIKKARFVNKELSEWKETKRNIKIMQLDVMWNESDLFTEDNQHLTETEGTASLVAHLKHSLNPILGLPQYHIEGRKNKETEKEENATYPQIREPNVGKNTSNIQNRHWNRHVDQEPKRHRDGRPYYRSYRRPYHSSSGNDTSRDRLNDSRVETTITKMRPEYNYYHHMKDRAEYHQKRRRPTWRQPARDSYHHTYNDSREFYQEYQNPPPRRPSYIDTYNHRDHIYVEGRRNQYRRYTRY